MNPDNHLLVDVADAVMTVQFNRPEKKNAITQPMYRALFEALDGADKDDGVHVVLLRGTEGCFSAGNDINDLATGMRVTSAPAGNFMNQLMNMQKPLIAAVSGPAIGIGLTMLLQCDLIYADPSARFVTPFTALGVCPEAGASFSLAQRVGYTRAAEMLLLSDPVDADKAAEIGLINAVFPADRLYAEAQTIAKRLAQFSPTSVRLTKSLMHTFESEQSQQAFDREIEGFKTLLESPAAKAAFAAFLDKK